MARWFKLSLSVADPFVGRCLTSSAMLRFTLIEPDGFAASALGKTQAIALAIACDPVCS